MQNQSNLNVSVGDRYNAPANNQPEEKFSIEDVPVFSMKKDLELLKNPSLLHQESQSLPSSPAARQTAPSPKTSPFLEKFNQPSAVPVPQKTPEKIVEKPQPKRPPLPEAPDSSEQNILKKIFVFSIVSLSVIALGIGSYYFWLVRGEQEELAVEETAIDLPASDPVSPEEPSAPAAIVEPETKPDETPKENIIVLDLDDSTPVKIKTAIKNQIEKLPRESFSKPIEFKIKDSQNNPLPFSSFAQKSGIAFAQKLSSHLGESFSLLAFNDGLNLGTGLIVESKNDLLLAREMLKEEIALPKELDVIFLPDQPKETKKISFSNFSYRDITLRYFNIISQEKLSVDYAITKNKLLIGTTRNTLTAIYDWFALKSEIQ